MPFEFENLDDLTRSLMLDEVGIDLASGPLYESVRLTDAGAGAWENLFRAACQAGDDVTLVAALGVPGGPYIDALEPNPRAPGESKRVPSNAAATMAEGEFNRYYIRALCRRAMTDGARVQVYRARFSRNPDPESEAKIGTEPDPAAVLADLRASQGVATALGLPSHPNSGLSIRLLL
jgi:hypothetical protein